MTESVNVLGILGALNGGVSPVLPGHLIRTKVIDAGGLDLTLTDMVSGESDEYRITVTPVIAEAVPTGAASLVERSADDATD